MTNLQTAIREAKVAAGLDPDKQYPPVKFTDHLTPELRMEFWQWQVDRVMNRMGATET